ncbi:MAG: MBL fold metallo-hydrolase [Acidimicrobiaceae bacterium]|nr:MBL fold metallo-hydrolase [Acidimicrobiaceae bacterium]
MTLHWTCTGIEVHKLVVGPLDNNVFFVRCTQADEAVLIDAANDPNRLLDLCRAFNVKAVIQTHGHSDHIQAIPALREAGYKIGIHAGDAAMLKEYDYLLEDDIVIRIGELRLRTIHTPGHTPGSMSFHLEDTPLLFAGDTLFPGGPGATKFEYSDFKTIIKSIEDRLFRVFGLSTIVLPGHGDDTTIGAEAPHLEEWIARGW